MDLGIYEPVNWYKIAKRWRIAPPPLFANLLLQPITIAFLSKFQAQKPTISRKLEQIIRFSLHK